MRPVTSVSPDWCLRGVRQKCAPTLREDRKRAGSSTATAKVSATIAPTPGVVISRRVGALLLASAERRFSIALNSCLNGVDAREKMQAFEPDLAVLDLAMP